MCEMSEWVLLLLLLMLLYLNLKVRIQQLKFTQFFSCSQVNLDPYFDILINTWLTQQQTKVWHSYLKRKMSSFEFKISYISILHVLHQLSLNFNYGTSIIHFKNCCSRKRQHQRINIEIINR